MSRHTAETFFLACEVASPPRIALGDGRTVRALTHPFAVVGSDPRCDLVLHDPSVSPRHCYLHAIGSKVLCVDLASGHGIDAGAGPTRASWVDHRHSLRVGSRTLRLLGPGEGPGAAPAPWAGPDGPLFARPVPKVVLEFRANQVKTLWQMRRAVALVGRAWDCTVRLDGAGVSDYHCALVLTGLGLWVVDLLGCIEPAARDGVSVNGERLRFGRLDQGDSFQVGRFTIRVRDVCPTTSHGPAAHLPDDGSGPGSGEIELSARPRPATGGLPAASGAAWEGLRRSFDERLRQEAERHRAEVEALRHEIEALRGRVDSLATPPPRRRRRRRRRRSFVDQPRPLEFSPRTLGVATRRLVSPADTPALPPPSHPADAGFSGAGPFWTAV